MGGVETAAPAPTRAPTRARAIHPSSTVPRTPSVYPMCASRYFTRSLESSLITMHLASRVMSYSDTYATAVKSSRKLKKVRRRLLCEHSRVPPRRNFERR